MKRKCPYGKLKVPIGRRVCKKPPGRRLTAKRKPYGRRKLRRLTPAEDAARYAAMVARYGDPERGLHRSDEDSERRRILVGSTPAYVDARGMHWDDGTITPVPL